MCGRGKMEICIVRELLEAAEAYNKILDEVDSYTFIPSDIGENPDNAPSGHEYTLTEATGDDVPELLVRTQAQMIQFVRIFSSDGTDVPVQAPEESLQTGASSAGEFVAPIEELSRVEG